MAIYKIDEVLQCLSSMKQDGYEYIGVSIIEAEDDMEESLSIDAIISKNDSENDMIDSVSLPEDYYLDL